MRLCEHGLAPTYVDPNREALICTRDEMFLRRTPGAMDKVVPVAEAKRYDFSAHIFCRSPDCLNAPGHGEDCVFCEDHKALLLSAMPNLLAFADLDTASRVSHQASTRIDTLDVTVATSHHFIYLTDGEPPYEPPRIGPGAIGLIHTRRGKAALITATHTGNVSVAIAVANRDPGPDLSGFDDIVEADFVARTSDLILSGPFELEPHRLPPPPVGPGAYRLRYHARDLDTAPYGTSQGTDIYLLQIFPTRPAPPNILMETSRFARMRRTGAADG